MCGPIKEESASSGSLSAMEGGDVVDDVFMDNLEGGATGGVNVLVDTGAVSSVDGAIANISAEDNNKDGEVGSMDMDGGGEVGSFITMEEVVNIVDDNGENCSNSNKEGGNVSDMDVVDNISETIGAEVEVKEDIGANNGGGNEMGGGGDEVGANGSPVVPLPLIPRWRLREILAHAEGKCNCVVLIV